MSQTMPRTAGTGSDAPVYIDANPLSDRHLTGIGRYAARLALAMGSLREVRFFVGDRVIEPPSDLGWEQDQDLGAWARRLWRGGKAPIGRPPSGSIGIWPLLRPVERRFDHEVSILHDLTPLLLPQTHKAGTRSHFQGMCAKAIAGSDVALAVSDSTKADAEWLVNIDPARIVVAHSGPSLCVARHIHQGPVQRQPNVGLVVSTLEPRKNPEFFCDWFHTSSALPNDAELWWVGSIGWITSKRDLRAFERRPGSRRRIKFLGVVDDARLCRLYRTAAYSAYPSLYEGFGFPVLDSLRHHTPVLAAQNSSIREFDSPGLFFFDPLDKPSLDQAYQRCRAEAIGRAIPQAPLEENYSWRNVARTILNACEANPETIEGSIAAA